MYQHGPAAMTRSAYRGMVASVSLGLLGRDKVRRVSRVVVIVLAIVGCGRVNFDPLGGTGPISDGSISDDSIAINDGKVVTSRHWVNRGASPPGGLTGARMAYDSKRNRILMFGGVGPSTASAALWAYTAGGWQQLCASCPPGPRSGPGFAYDPIRDRAVVFGGANLGVLGDTWEYDGTGWMQTATTGPGTRAQPNLYFDPSRGKIVLIGGIDTGMFRPLVFTYDGSWSNVSPPDGPNLLGGFGQTVTYDADISRMLSLAGVGTSDDTLWTLGATWTELCTTCSGAARRDASMVYDPSLHTVWMTGGATSGSDDGLAGTWVLQGSSWKQVFTDPPGRAASALAYDPGRDVIVLYGGNSSLNCAPQCDETWELVPD